MKTSVMIHVPFKVSQLGRRLMIREQATNKLLFTMGPPAEVDQRDWAWQVVGGDCSCGAQDRAEHRPHAADCSVHSGVEIEWKT